MVVWDFLWLGGWVCSVWWFGFGGFGIFGCGFRFGCLLCFLGLGFGVLCSITSGRFGVSRLGGGLVFLVGWWLVDWFGCWCVVCG